MGWRASARTAIAAIAVAAVALAAGTARAEDWRYCLAPLRAEHKVYISVPFFTTKSMERLQDEFASALARAGLRHGAVQCPRGDEQSIAAMRTQAARFNRESGNAVVDFDRWDP
jgi:ABC-type sugar transport system substrate-binding protein